VAIGFAVGLVWSLALGAEAEGKRGYGTNALCDRTLILYASLSHAGRFPFAFFGLVPPPLETLITAVAFCSRASECDPGGHSRMAGVFSHQSCFQPDRIIRLVFSAIRAPRYRDS